MVCKMRFQLIKHRQMPVCDNKFEGIEFQLENAVTTSIKKLNPISQYENTARLGKFIPNIPLKFNPPNRAASNDNQEKHGMQLSC